MNRLIYNRLFTRRCARARKTGFIARSVGSETRLSGCWIRMLLSIAMSYSRNNDTFDNLVVWNII